MPRTWLTSSIAGRATAAGLAWSALAYGFGANPALAHPHVWVTMRTEVVVEQGTIVGFRHAWIFDEYYSATAIEGLDTNKDGIYSREELSELAKVNVEALKDFSFFTFPRLSGKDLELGAPRDYWLEHSPKPPPQASAAGAPAGSAAPQASGSDRIASAAEKAAGGVLTLRFTVPLVKPVLAEAADFTFSVGDPTFFIAFEPAPDNPVTLSAGTAKDCHVGPAVEKPDANPSKPGDLMATQPAPGLTISSATVWKVTCKAPS